MSLVGHGRPWNVPWARQVTGGATWFNDLHRHVSTRWRGSATTFNDLRRPAALAGCECPQTMSLRALGSRESRRQWNVAGGSYFCATLWAQQELRSPLFGEADCSDCMAVGLGIFRPKEDQ
jgi:hypothetical protein